MKRIIVLLFVVVFVLCSFTACRAASDKQEDFIVKNEKTEIYYEETSEEHIKESNGIQYADNEILVVSKENVKKTEIELLARKYNAKIVGYIEITGDYQWKLNDVYTYEELCSLAETIKSEDIIEDAYLQGVMNADANEYIGYIKPNDSRWKNEWDYVPGGENWGIEAIQAPYAWAFVDKMIPVRVGLIDGMFNTTHEDLSFSEVYYNPDDSSINESHGSHVAGTIAAKYNNGVGITGVYPFGENKDGTSNLYAVSCKGTEDRSTLFFWKTAFARLVIKNVKVINLSWGYSDVISFLAVKGYQEAQDYISDIAKIMGNYYEKLLNEGYDFVIVQSAGNNRDDYYAKKDDSVDYPYGWSKGYSIFGETNVDGMANWNYWTCAIDNPIVRDRIIVVGAVKMNKAIFTGEVSYEIASFSDTGTRVDIMAPGVDITSCGLNNGYEKMNGTSMAAPHVTGAAATLWAFNNSLTGKQIKEILVNTSKHNVKGTDVGLLYLPGALAEASVLRSDSDPVKKENGIVSGLVFDSNGELNGVTVNVINQSSNSIVDTQITDDEGFFAITLDDGTYDLEIKKEGYNTKKFENISVKKGELNYLGEIELLETLKDFSIPSELVVTIGEISAIEPETDPENASDYSLKWSSSDENVAKVSPTGENGIVTALSKGTTTITAELTSGNETITKTTNLRVASKARDTILVLDVSGSMWGKPIEEMKESAIQFCNDLLKDEYNNRVGLVFFADSIKTVDLTNDLNLLIDKIKSISANGGTGMEKGISEVDSMFKNNWKSDSIKNVVMMADGLPNRGKTSNSGSMPFVSGVNSFGFDSDITYASAVIDTVEGMSGSYNIYSLGFFHSMSEKEKEFASVLMQKLTNKTDGYHQVDKAEDLQFAFGDISETISIGSKIVINIACPVDVYITYNGETLSSSEENYCDTTSFGTLQLLGKNQDIKVASLDSDKEYEIELIGTGVGKMDYSVNYFDADEKRSDYRAFESIPITPATVIKTNTNNTDEVELNVDEDGDGETDIIWTALSNSKASVTYGNTPPVEEPEIEEPVVEEPEEEKLEKEKNEFPVYAVIIVALGLFAVIFGIVVVVITGGSSDKADKEIESNEINNVDMVKCSKCGKVHPSSKPCDCEIESANKENSDETTPLEMSGGIIKVETSSMKGFKVPIKDKETLYLGKDASRCNLVFTGDYKNVSRMHCSVTYDEKLNKYFVVDSSSNGTFHANNDRFVKGQRTAVEPNSILILANDECAIRLK